MLSDSVRVRVVGSVEIAMAILVIPQGEGNQKL